MFGKNIITKPNYSNESTIRVHSIFYTIQGEGSFTGNPAVFIRLQGCNLQCPFCDTDFDNGTSIDIKDIVKRVEKLSTDKTNLVVITGGEPLIQPINSLCKLLIKKGKKVQIETNGTLYIKLPKKVYIVCSPKSNSAHAVHPKLFKRINSFKFLVSANHKKYNYLTEEIANKARSMNIPIYIQPMDEYNKEKNERNNNLVVKMAMENGYKVSLQIHKILNIE